MKIVVSFILFFILVFIVVTNLILAKGISDCLLTNGTTLIINPNGTVLKYVNGKLFDENIEVHKYSYFLLSYYDLRYNLTNIKDPLKIQLPPDATIIFVTPTPSNYGSVVENGKTTISINWENQIPQSIYIEYGNILANFLRNFENSLKIR